MALKLPVDTCSLIQLLNGINSHHDKLLEIRTVLLNAIGAVKAFYSELKCPVHTNLPLFFKYAANNFNKELTLKTVSCEHDESEN